MRQLSVVQRSGFGEDQVTVDRSARVSCYTYNYNMYSCAGACQQQPAPYLDSILTKILCYFLQLLCCKLVLWKLCL